MLLVQCATCATNQKLHSLAIKKKGHSGRDLNNKSMYTRANSLRTVYRRFWLLHFSISFQHLYIVVPYSSIDLFETVSTGASLSSTFPSTISVWSKDRTSTALSLIQWRCETLSLNWDSEPKQLVGLNKTFSITGRYSKASKWLHSQNRFFILTHVKYYCSYIPKPLLVPCSKVLRTSLECLRPVATEPGLQFTCCCSKMQIRG